MSDWITKKSNTEETGSKWIQKKKVNEPQNWITKKEKKPEYITKKTPEEIREREMTRTNKMGGGSMRTMYKSGGCAQIKGFGKARRPKKKYS
tara:strand:- start:164 stop:439 length:276 start_codon:yes stop_codon:yes gene_type:complete